MKCTCYPCCVAEFVLRVKGPSRLTLRANFLKHSMKLDSAETLRRPPAALAGPLPTNTSKSHYIDPRSGDGSYPNQPHRELNARDAAALNTLRAHVLATNYPCVMARSVFNRDAFRMATYGVLGAKNNASLLAEDLYQFCAEFPAPVQGAVSFVACFDAPFPADEAAFERALWSQLQVLHDVDKQRFDWSVEVESAPDSPDFSFSVGGRAFFLVGMHPAASRTARRTPMPVLVFNLHEQFVELREHGKFDKVRDTIQLRDKQLQGSVNPMSADHGLQSEAAQYSGRHVGDEWACPFVFS